MKRYLPQLDGLRTLAVTLVIGTHTGLIPAGYVGVDVFFVLSGYLITTILLEQKESGRWSLKAFYANRMRRLYPALIMLLLVALIAAPPVVVSSGAHRFIAVAICAAYLSDFATALQGTHLAWLQGLSHTWSLALEEQFYLLWPLVLKHLTAVRLWLIGGLCVGMLILLAVGSTAMLYLPFSRGGNVLLGCFLAFGIREKRVAHPDLLAGVSVTGLVVVLLMPTPTSGPIGLGGASVLAGFASVGLIAGLVQGSIIARGFALPPLVWLGKRSYGIYLWHVPIAFYLFNGYVTAPVTTFRNVALIAGGGVLMAAISYRVVEQPFRSRRDYIDPPGVVSLNDATEIAGPLHV